MKNNKENKFSYITEGPIMRSMIKLALPIMLSQFFQTLYNLADTLWVGKVGADAVAAISISFPIIFLMISIGVGLTIAGTALIAQHKGAQNHLEVDKVMGQTFGFVGVLSIIIAIVGFLLAKQIIILMGADPEIVNDAAGYIRIIFIGMPFMFGFFIFSSSLRGIGDTVTPTIMMIISVVMNIILDPLMIFGIGPFPKLGVQGAAWATIISRAVVTVYAIFILTKGTKGIHLRLKYMKPDFNIIKMIVKIGIPSSIEQSMLSFGRIFMTSLAASFGTMTLAAYGIVNRVISLPIILAFGLSASVTTMVGQNIGADKNDRAEKVAYKSLALIFIVLTITGIIAAVFPGPIVRLFNNERDVVEYGRNFLRISGLTIGLMGVQVVSNGVFKGAGRTIPPMIISTLTLWIFRVPLAYLLAKFFDWNQSGLWWAFAISNLVGALMGVTWLKSVDWSSKIIKKPRSRINRMIDEE